MHLSGNVVSWRTRLSSRLVDRTVALCSAVVATVSLFAAQSHAREACPPAIVEARRLIVVETAGWDTVKARLTTFERQSPATPWRRADITAAAVVGLKGMAWGFAFRGSAAPGEPAKVEGDRRAPAGLYAIGQSFGHGPSTLPGHITLAAGRELCVDDSTSPHYGAIVDRTAVAAGTKGEDMRGEPLYRRGIVIDYPTDAAARAGSCIFIHVWRSADKGTAGCIATDERDVATLQSWTAAAQTAIAILPAVARDRFANCLP